MANEQNNRNTTFEATGKGKQLQRTVSRASTPSVEPWTWPVLSRKSVASPSTAAPIVPCALKTPTVAGPSSPRILPTPPATAYSPSVYSATTESSGSRKITSALASYPRIRGDGTIDKGKERILTSTEMKEQMRTSTVGGAHMMSFSTSGKIWSHERAQKMRDEAAKKAAADKAAVQQPAYTATTFVPPVRHDSMNPEDENEHLEPNRPIFSHGVQKEEENPKKRSLLRRILRAVLRR